MTLGYLDAYMLTLTRLRRAPTHRHGVNVWAEIRNQWRTRTRTVFGAKSRQEEDSDFFVYRRNEYIQDTYGNNYDYDYDDDCDSSGHIDDYVWDNIPYDDDDDDENGYVIHVIGGLPE